MNKLSREIVKLRIPILILSILLLIPAGIGYIKTRINYNVLDYLPKEIDTMKGQDILLDEFGKGAYATVVVENMDAKDLTKLENKIKAVDHVTEVISYNGFSGSEIPVGFLPTEIRKEFYNDNSDATLFAIFFDDSTSSDGTMQAIKEIRKVTDHQCFVSGMAAVVTDTKDLAEAEANLYVMIAVLLVAIVLAVFMDSFLVPVFFLVSIGMAILYNLGSNVFFGQISYVTKSLAAVLQLGVTLDYSIFLWNTYKEEKEEYPNDHREAMALAISHTFTSVVGSSVTTVAGFVALCFMSFTLGLDIGIVMAKGVVFGVIGCTTILPSLILTFDRALEHTMHRQLMPDFSGMARWITKHFYVFLILLLVLFYPAYYGQKNTRVYYDLANTLPARLDSSQANKKLSENFDMNSVYMVLVDTNMTGKDAKAMVDEIKKQDGITFALGYNSVLGNDVPDEFVPNYIKEKLKGDTHQLIMVASDYKVASDEVNAQIDAVNDIVKRYDENGMVIGEAPCTKDLIKITAHDFQVVNVVSILFIFLIIFFVFKSVTLPLVLVLAIEFAIFINMGVPYYMNTEIPFIASVVIGTIQLGSTVDYAILMTTRYRRERFLGNSKEDSITTALATSIPSIIVSALGFFAATFGVGLIASVDMIASLCTLMARGALVSMVVVILILPSLFMLCDKIIIHTSKGFIDKSKKNSKAVA